MISEAWTAQVRGRLFDQIPSGIAIIDRSLTVVDHNRAFASLFGAALGRPCFECFKGTSGPCGGCPAEATFADGRLRVSEQCGSDLEGHSVDYLVQMSPIRGEDGEVEQVAAITTDLTATKRLQREYGTLFEKVPCFVAVINRDHRVVKANEAFRRVFGEPTGDSCYRLYKRRSTPCPDCPVDRTFSDGGSHSSRQTGVSRGGQPVPYLVFTAPLLRAEEEVTHVIEMALDMTEHQDLEEQLTRANVLRQAVVESSLDGIVVFDTEQKVVLLNNAAAQLWGYSETGLVGHRAPPRMLPEELGTVLSGRTERLLVQEAAIITRGGDEVPVRIAAASLRFNGRSMGASVIAQDLRAVKQLEREKLVAERLAAVGQTVAGLAHGIKNILTGLEGGMYVVSSGLKREDQSRVEKGWEMLERNIGRISDLAKNLLAFSRGETLKCRLLPPAEVAQEVIDLYRDGAAQRGISLRAELDATVAPASFDPEGLHSCLANLVSNAIDACLVSNRRGCEITLSLRETDGDIQFEVSDTGCGMDYEIKQKVFTSFFTTKGKGGSGLGLLLTRKIVQQHGGSIELETEVGAGTTFRIRFPRSRLPKPEAVKEEDHRD